MGASPRASAGRSAAAHERAIAHFEPHSVWLHNSVRGAVALGLAVLVANRTGVQHSFWVIFGTLSVLRSNALNTGQFIARGILGTCIGFVIGAVALAIIGTDTTVLWILLPFVVLFAGIAPAVISFTAGQAAFTLTLLILFNLVQPAGWRLGIVRIEDVAIGFGVSLAVGLLFWPRGAGAALRKALAEAYADSARYLEQAVEYGMRCCDDASPAPTAPSDAAIRSAAASRRLDDAFRSYLAERGAEAGAARRYDEPRDRRRGAAPDRRRGARPLAAGRAPGRGRPGGRARPSCRRRAARSRAGTTSLSASLAERRRGSRAARAGRGSPTRASSRPCATTWSTPTATRTRPPCG